jgi:hypothetical protein
MDMLTLTPLLQAVGMPTIIALLAWLVRRTFTHTIPRLATDFKDALSEQHKFFSNQLEMQREDFKAALAQQRVDFMGERDQFSKRLDRLADAVESLTLHFERDFGNNNRGKRNSL